MVKMGENPLDWKKVFKKILLGECEELQNESLSTEREKADTSINETKDFTFSSCSVNLESSFKEKNISKSESCAKFSYQNLFKKSTRSILNLNFNIEQPCSLTMCDNGQVPEWNKAFKNILGKKSSERTYSSTELHDNAQQKCESSSKTGKFCVKKTPSRSLYKIKKQSEEEKVRELFALSRLFKLESPHYNLNDFEGAGVNIFKSSESKSDLASFPRKSQYQNHSQNSNPPYSSDPKPFDPYVHLTGFIATTPYTKADVQASTCVSLTEVWDDDFFF